MCQLLGLSSNKAVNISFSLKEFQERGAHNHHGWGFAYRTGSDWRIIKKAESLHDANVNTKPFQFYSKIIIGHVRLASCGNIKHQNTHPFQNAKWVFAHNGTVSKIKNLPEFQLRTLKPQGDTDSEFAFLSLLETLGSTKTINFAALQTQVGKIKQYGNFNFLLSDGNSLLAHGHNSLYYTLRQAPFQKVTLRDAEYQVDLNDIKDPDEQAVLIATEPLTTNEDWIQIEGLRIFKNGAEVVS